MDEVKTAAESLMTALDARVKSLSVTNKRAEQELHRMTELINVAASDGRTRIQLEHKLMDAVQRHLESKGYVVESWNDPRESVSYTTIDWGGC